MLISTSDALKHGGLPLIMYFVSRCPFPTAHFLQQNTGWWFICRHHMRHACHSHNLTQRHRSMQFPKETWNHLLQTHLRIAISSDIPDRCFEIRFHSAWLRICHCMFMNACVVLLSSKSYRAQQRLHLGSGRFGHFQIPTNQLWDESQSKLCFETKSF